MIFERIESAGIAHYSYIFGDKTSAVVIDPRRDSDIYIRKAASEGLQIRHILETHRNEDYVIGSVELAHKTSAEIWHADRQLNYKYGNNVDDGQKWEIDRFKIKAIHTPGHTMGSMSYLLYDQNGKPWMIFTGDVLFAGDVGRVDLMGPDETEAMAANLYDSIFNKILPLGDEVILCPAHGSGSVCGASIAERTWTTVGIERKHSPKLQHTEKDDFVKAVSNKLERPPYFDQMEKLNIEGAPIFGNLPSPPKLTPGEFTDILENTKATVLDTRMELGFASAHVPNAFSMWLKGLPNFAGWFIPYNAPILLVNENKDSREAVRKLVRLGYDDIRGELSKGMLGWHMSGQKSDSIATVNVNDLCEQLDSGDNKWILDIRSDEEIDQEGKIQDSTHIHVTRIPERFDEIPKDKKITIFCGSGMRSMIAASVLRQNGWKDLEVVLGGVSAWTSSTCPLEIMEE